MFKLGLIINPVAGLGGTVALKGSDGLTEQALALGAIPQANQRARACLELLLPYQSQITIYTASGEMGERLSREMGFRVECLYQAPEQSGSEDTIAAVHAFANAQINLDLLLFAGGDGTARNIVDAEVSQFAYLGIPAGCKIHSGVYGVTPQASAQVIIKLIHGELLSLQKADVMDIDEAQVRLGRVRARFYGELLVPMDLRYIQAVKQSGIEQDSLVLDEIAEYLIENMDDSLYLIGSGSTVARIMQNLSLENTLLGVDLIKNHTLLDKDLTAKQIIDKIRSQNSKLIVTPIGGQGHLFGRGNQQLSAEVIRSVGRENIQVIATKQKLKALQGRPLIADTGDAALDQSLSGYIKVITGYQDYVMYRVSNPQNEVLDATTIHTTGSAKPS